MPLISPLRRERIQRECPGSAGGDPDGLTGGGELGSGVTEVGLAGGLVEPLVHVLEGSMTLGRAGPGRLDLAEHGGLFGGQGSVSTPMRIVPQPPEGEVTTLQGVLDVGVAATGQSHRGRCEAAGAERPSQPPHTALPSAAAPVLPGSEISIFSGGR